MSSGGEMRIINMFFTLINICFLLLCSSLFSQPYWVDDDGVATWADARSSSPLSGASCCSYATANKNADAGDTVYYRAGTYTISGGNAIDPSNTGTAGNKIVFMAYNSEEVIFNYTGSSTGDYAVDLNSDAGTVRSNIVINGITFTNFNKHLWILRGDYNEISNCSFTGFTAAVSSLTWRGSTIYRDARYNWVHDCTFGGFGGYTPSATCVTFELGNEAASNDSTQRNLIEDNHIYHGGHHAFGMNGHHNIVRNNYVHNEAWGDYGGTLYGERVVFMVGHDGDDERNLIEGNRIAYGGALPGSHIGGSGGTIASRFNIIRKNMYYHNLIYGSYIKYYVGQGTGSNNYVYNNVYYHNGYDSTQTGKSEWSNYYTHGLMFIDNATYSKDNIIKNNIFYDNKNITNDTIPMIEFDGTEPDNQTLSNNWKGGIHGDPKFEDISGTPDPMNQTKFDFHLQFNSGCIDNGGWLTTVTNANGSGTSFTVADAGYFFDGWGIGDAIPTASVLGDIIQFEGQTQTAVITKVNYNTNTITINTPLTWINGQGVGLKYNGSAMDLGAYETIYTPPPLLPPQNLRILK
jgi:hypothetical protein